LRNVTIVSCDVLIIGGGGAGLRAAIQARESGVTVTVVSKSRAGYGNNTDLSNGTFAAATGWRDPRDNLDVPMSYTRIALPIVGLLLVFQLVITLYERIGLLRSMRSRDERTGDN